jgi:zinc/manganese transport system ATP-binding protein
VENLAFGYGGQAAVAGLSGVFTPGSLTALVGANGAGKSTLLKGLAGALPPLRGEIACPAGSRTAYLPQQSELDPTFPTTVAQAAGFGLAGRQRPRDRTAKVEAALRVVDLANLAAAPLDILSGGQLQRVLLARLILQDADIVLLDEPFRGLDQATTEAMLAVLAQWAAEGRVVVAAIHDLDQARAHFPFSLRLAADKPPVWGRRALQTAGPGR